MSKDTIATVLERRSVRKYNPAHVPTEDLTIILEAGRQAPSAHNGQPWHFVAVRDPEVKKALGIACNNQIWIPHADVVIAGVGLPRLSERWFAIDVTIALQNMVLAATGLGYGTCWIGAFDEAKAKQVLGIPEELRLVALTAIGIAAERPAAKPRKPFAEIFSLDRFGAAIDLERRAVRTVR
ncbi:MAG: nitroreductase [Chloroflexota bacterium]|nr:MAG: nitroreductase [Chloroflexota bacterium]